MKNFTEYVLNVAMVVILLLPVAVAMLMIVVGVIEEMNIVEILVATLCVSAFAVPFSYYGAKALIAISNRLY